MLSAEQYRQAEFGYTVAEAKRGFKIHVAVYALVMTALSALNALLWVYADVNFRGPRSRSSGGASGSHSTTSTASDGRTRQG